MPARCETNIVCRFDYPGWKRFAVRFAIRNIPPGCGEFILNAALSPAARFVGQIQSKRWHGAIANAGNVAIKIITEKMDDKKDAKIVEETLSELE